METKDKIQKLGRKAKKRVLIQVNYKFSPENQLKLQLLALAQHRTMSSILEELINDLWQRQGDKEFATLSLKKASRYVQHTLERATREKADIR